MEELPYDWSGENVSSPLAQKAPFIGSLRYSDPGHSGAGTLVEYPPGHRCVGGVTVP